MKFKNKKGYSLIETTAGFVLIIIASIIIAIGMKAGLSGYTEGRKIHTINEQLMTSIENNKKETGITESENPVQANDNLTITSKNGTYEFKGKLKTYTYKDEANEIAYTTFELSKP